MKDNKIINKNLEKNKFPLQKQNIPIKGKILSVTSTPYPKKKIFILTDNNDDCIFYVIENNKFNAPQEYILNSEVLKTGKLNGKKINFQTETLESQIWTDKSGNHVIIKIKNVCFYYNPFMAKKIEELNLILFGSTLIQPYAVIFNDERCNENDTGIFLISDFNSSIFEVQLILTKKKEVLRTRLGELLKLKPDKRRRTVVDYEISLFDMDKNDRIVDFKLFTENDNILLIAITKRIVFQFVGKKDFRNVLENYDLEYGNIIKGVKKFFPQKSKQTKKIKQLKNGEKKEITQIVSEERESSKFTRIQLILNKEKKKEWDSIGFMTDCGYIILDINKDLKPQNTINICKYYKREIETKEQSEIIHQVMPKAVCESNFNRFFLYSNYLVVQNKLTNGINHNENLPYQFIDLFYNEDSIILYNEKNIYKIELENELENIYEDYIEKGDYKTALELKKDDKYLTPSLHKIYGDYLYDNKQYMQAAIEYAFSNEFFENVCIKFLNMNNIKALIRYLILIIRFRIQSASDKKKEKEENKEENKKEQFIEKFLLHTWLLELLIEKLENNTDNELVQEIKEISRCESNGTKYLNSDIIYDFLNLFDKQQELIEFAYLKKNHEIIISSLINRNKIESALEQFEACLFGDESEFDKKLKKNFYKYGNLMIKKNIKKTIDSLRNYFKPEKAEEVFRLLISPDLKLLSEKETEFKLLVDYIKELLRKSYKIGDKEYNLTKSENLHNLYILLVSYGKSEKFKIALFSDLKSVINSFINDQQLSKKVDIKDKIFFDLNFAKKIFKEKDDKKSQEILCLIYYLLNQYIDFTDLAIKNDFQDLIFDLTKNIKEEKLKKKIWLKIFQYVKANKSLSVAKELINKSKNMIKIEDVIPLMNDDEKLNDLKEELTNCIQRSEESVRKLNNEIREFNESNNLINKDIEFSEKRAVKKKFTDLRCSKCGRNINSGRNTKFFLFPCQHIFDLQCLIDTYMEFNNHNLNNENFGVKIGVIKDLSDKIRKMEEKKSKALEGKGVFGNEEEYVLNNTKKILYDYLDDECLLCGQEMIDSTQIEFGNDEKFEWDLI